MRALPLALLLAAAAPAAWAQRFFDDNELRAGIIAIDADIQRSADRINVIREQIGKLEIETVEMERLLSELRAENAGFKAAAAARQKLIDAGGDQLDDELREVVAAQGGQLNELQGVLASADAKAFRAALALHYHGAPADEALAALAPLAADAESPYQDEARFWTGLLQHGAGDYGLARDTLAGFVRDWPGDAREPEALYLLADIAAKVDGDRSSSWRSMLLRLHPDSFAAARLREQ
ncbi:MAG: hypothetical protein ISN26_05175 [Betaproteobacteria bacterium AqS2]|uniref:Tetratricopeptide repeat protein n=1 Tax=Candidatus Amphirhobacter heronislandensis TaxID=1732024 RepID=A0A930UGW0_9GAMM|nr:hypothetical protein [Betaproteobacteria bacterium AqS2]